MPRATKTTPPKSTKATKVVTPAKAPKAAKVAKATRVTKATKVTPAKPARPAKVTPSVKRAAPASSAAPAAAPAKAPKPAAAAKRSSGGAAADKFLEAQRVALLGEREAYARQAHNLLAEAEQLAADREPGDVQFDEESGQGDSMNVERERDLVLSAQAMAAVEDIDLALTRIDAGTYGVCEKCGEPIPRERLRALPSAALCVKCKSGGLSRR